jgi:phospholipase/lecithinase/hemolysin
MYSNTKLYNYAVSGAVCSNSITPRFFSAINAPFPAVTEYEVPAFLADSKYTSPNRTVGKFFTGKPRDTVYAIWIGTNDLGNNAFLTDSQIRGKTLADYVDCVYAVVDSLYKGAGAKYFVLMNLAPLYLLPQYATPENGGLPATQYFPEKAGMNITAVSYRMKTQVVTVNEVFAYRTPYETEIADRWDGDVKIANFDVGGLLTDMYYNPKNYLNGTAPLNVTGIVNQCDLQGKNCVRKASPDSYMWFDELHPSEQTGRVVAREFVGVLSGKSKWAKYWG